MTGRGSARQAYRQSRALRASGRNRCPTTQTYGCGRPNPEAPAITGLRA